MDSMDLYDLRGYFTDACQPVIIWDIYSECVIYQGPLDEMPREFESYLVGSIDTIYSKKEYNGYITINVDKNYEESK